MATLVFVYGTLKSGFPNADTNRGVRVDGEYITAEPFSLYICGERNSPCMIQESQKGVPVAGELYSVDENTLSDMDKLERITAPDGYRRREIFVRNSSTGAEVAAQVYISQPHLLTQPINAGPLPCYTKAWAERYVPRTPRLSLGQGYSVQRAVPLKP